MMITGTCTGFNSHATTIHPDTGRTFSMELSSNVSGVLGDVAVTAEELAENAMSAVREHEAFPDNQDKSTTDISTEDTTPQATVLKSGDKFSLTSFLSSFSINLILPFINGLMLGFGEIIAHEIGFRYHWVGAKIYRPQSTQNQKSKLL